MTLIPTDADPGTGLGRALLALLVIALLAAVVVEAFRRDAVPQRARQARHALDDDQRDREGGR